MIKKVTREEAIDYLEWVRPKKPYTQDKKNVQTAIDMAIEALKETERNPTITSWYDFDRGYEKGKAASRSHGEWKYNPDCVNDEMQAEFFCSICNRGAYSRLDNFCPNCGADMRKEGEAE